MTNAATIVAVGERANIPPRGWVIAIATAMQESGLRNVGNLGSSNDHDSIGLFQQRPSEGWGTAAQLKDPAYAATKLVGAAGRMARRNLLITKKVGQWSDGLVDGRIVPELLRREFP